MWDDEVPAHDSDEDLQHVSFLRILDGGPCEVGIESGPQKVRKVLQYSHNSTGFMRCALL